MKWSEFLRHFKDFKHLQNSFVKNTGPLEVMPQCEQTIFKKMHWKRFLCILKRYGMIVTFFSLYKCSGHLKTLSIDCQQDHFGFSYVPQKPERLEYMR